jgi:hypothetical protein
MAAAPALDSLSPGNRSPAPGAARLSRFMLRNTRDLGNTWTEDKYGKRAWDRFSKDFVNAFIAANIFSNFDQNVP